MEIYGNTIPEHTRRTFWSLNRDMNSYQLVRLLKFDPAHGMIRYDRSVHREGSMSPSPFLGIAWLTRLSQAFFLGMPNGNHHFVQEKTPFVIITCHKEMLGSARSSSHFIRGAFHQLRDPTETMVLTLLFVPAPPQDSKTWTS